MVTATAAFVMVLVVMVMHGSYCCCISSRDELGASELLRYQRAHKFSLHGETSALIWHSELFRQDLVSSLTIGCQEAQ